MSTTPTTDSVNELFDGFDKSIDDIVEKWQNGSQEWAKKRMQELIKYIKEQTQKKQDELDENQKNSEAPSKFMQALQSLQEGISELPDLINKVAEFAQAAMDMFAYVQAIIADAAMAPATFANRSASTAMKIANATKEMGMSVVDGAIDGATSKTPTTNK